MIRKGQLDGNELTTFQQFAAQNCLVSPRTSLS